ncbi:Flagellum site-determining protein YlxH [Planctomycetes bacterium Poly30]|uniref:Flagellum site-determining protein YlxH n=1 Tax=Saltatorellus ferox TaxID=2528018 RepID=A0A518EXR2_9BACT|nr:Flagellum site-determining protein YlxH [Planctomycetes bacterium Poly30]
MLNRFQFARLRAFRRGNKATDETSRSDPSRAEQARKGQDPQRYPEGQNPGGNANSGPAPGPSGQAGSQVHDSWQDDDRVARLLARRAAAQEEERQLALERLGGRAPATSGAPATVEPVVRPLAPGGKTTSVDFTQATPTERQPDARTTTVPALEPAPDAAAAASSTFIDDLGVEAGPAAGQRSTADPTAHASSWRRDGGRAATSARVVCIASGKGGTGKSVMATNLAILRARRGERVLLIDFDAGLANAHLLLGLAPPYDLGHVMEGEVTAREALVEGPHGVKLLSGGVGRQTMIDPTRRELDRLFKALRPLEAEFDLILIDHGAGLSYSTVAHLAATSTLILVTNHEVTALSDGYALYKRAHMVNHSIRVGLVVNRAPDERIAMDAWERFRGAAHKFLGHTPELIGWVPADPAIPQAVQMRQPAVISYPESGAARAIKRIAGWPPIDHARSATGFYDKARRALR